MFRKLIALSAIAVATLMIGVGPASASASVAMGIGSTATLTDRVLVSVPVDVTCSPDAGQQEANFVAIEQATAKGIAHGDGAVVGVVCDDTSHHYSVAILADTSGPAFKKGKAVVRGALGFCDWNTWPTVCVSAFSGPQSITLR